ncbi:MAG: hypothetical protein ACP5OG_04160 [Candidatus Nanoarchaeia archaeon]
MAIFQTPNNYISPCFPESRLDYFNDKVPVKAIIGDAHYSKKQEGYIPPKEDPCLNGLPGYIHLDLTPTQRTNYDLEGITSGLVTLDIRLDYNGYAVYNVLEEDDALLILDLTNTPRNYPSKLIGKEAIVYLDKSSNCPVGFGFYKKNKEKTNN